VIGEVGGELSADDGVDVGLHVLLGCEMDGKEEDAEMDAVGGRFVAGEEEDEGVAN